MKRKINRRLERDILELISLAKDLCPDAEIKVKVPGYEEFDAWLTIIMPDECFDKAEAALTRKCNELEDRDHYLIGLNIVERSAVDKAKTKP